jgi:GNAT superfamily N-acetyltransferase
MIKKPKPMANVSKVKGRLTRKKKVVTKGKLARAKITMQTQQTRAGNAALYRAFLGGKNGPQIGRLELTVEEPVEIKKGKFNMPVTKQQKNKARKWVNLFNFEVHLSQRGKGIGSRMVKQAIAFCRKNNIKYLEAEATGFSQPLFKRLGFERRFKNSSIMGLDVDKYFERMKQKKKTK